MKIAKIINFGCSFAYGNRAASFSFLGSEHKSVASGLAKHYDLEEFNLARPGNSNEGILDNVISWIATADKKDKSNSLLLVGWSGASRFGFVSDSIKMSNKARPAKEDDPVAENAFTAGPPNPYRYVIDKFDDRWATQSINLLETGRLTLYRSIISLQALEKIHDLKIIYYHSLKPMRPEEFPDINLYEENDKMSALINTDRFYRFQEMSLQEMTNENMNKYYVSSTDSHPNHVAYARWTRFLISWIEKNNRFGYQL